MKRETPLLSDGRRFRLLFKISKEALIENCRKRWKKEREKGGGRGERREERERGGGGEKEKEITDGLINPKKCRQRKVHQPKDPKSKSTGTKRWKVRDG